jgi:thioredoxin-related protein
MDAETFEKPGIANFLNENFYPVKFNAEQKESIDFAGNTFKFVANGRRGYHELAAALLGGKMSYPTVVFAHFNGNNFELLQRIPGYLDIPTFDMIMHYLAEEHYTSTSWPDYQKIYKNKGKESTVSKQPIKSAPKKEMKAPAKQQEITGEEKPQ